MRWMARHQCEYAIERDAVIIALKEHRLPSRDELLRRAGDLPEKFPKLLGRVENLSEDTRGKAEKRFNEVNNRKRKLFHKKVDAIVWSYVNGQDIMRVKREGVDLPEECFEVFEHLRKNLPTLEKRKWVE